jgi:hypothetical protein
VALGRETNTNLYFWTEPLLGDLASNLPVLRFLAGVS